VIDVAHHGHYRRPQNHILRPVFLNLEDFLLLETHTFDLEIEFRRQEARCVKVHGLVDVGREPQEEKLFQDLGRFHAHLFGQVCDGYGFIDLDPALADFRGGWFRAESVPRGREPIALAEPPAVCLRRQFLFGIEVLALDHLLPTDRAALPISGFTIELFRFGFPFPGDFLDIRLFGFHLQPYGNWRRFGFFFGLLFGDDFREPDDSRRLLLADLFTPSFLSLLGLALLSFLLFLLGSFFGGQRDGYGRRLQVGRSGNRRRTDSCGSGNRLRRCHGFCLGCHRFRMFRDRFEGGGRPALENGGRRRLVFYRCFEFGNGGRGLNRRDLPAGSTLRKARRLDGDITLGWCFRNWRRFKDRCFREVRDGSATLLRCGLNDLDCNDRAFGGLFKRYARNRFFFRRPLAPPNDGSADSRLFDGLRLGFGKLLSYLLHRRFSQGAHVVLDLNPQLKNPVDQILVVQVQFLCKFMHPHSCHEVLSPYPLLSFLPRFRVEPAPVASPRRLRRLTGINGQCLLLSPSLGSGKPSGPASSSSGEAGSLGSSTLLVPPCVVQDRA